MRKKIPVSELTVGMRVVELDISWLESPFWRNAFTIKTQNEITILRQHCKHVEISVANTINKPKKVLAHPSAPTSTSNSNAPKLPLSVTPSSSIASRAIPKPSEAVTAPQKLDKAKQRLLQASEEMKHVFDEARAGRALDAPKLQQSVELLTQDILTDANSLLLLRQMQSKDQNLSEKSINVCILTLTFAKHLGIKKAELHQLGLGALLHDIGMLRVPNALLNYQGALNASQKAIIQQHVIAGVSMVAHHETLSGIKDMIAAHHERHDGSGYPKGLKGKEIPLFARILGITTTYEAMTRERFFSAKATPTQALSRLYAWRHKLFDGRLVEKFIQALGVYPPGCVVMLNNGYIAIVTEINPDQRTRPVIRILMDKNKVVLKDQPEIDLCVARDEPLVIQKILDTRELVSVNWQ